jgi:hypothetical protein
MAAIAIVALDVAQRAEQLCARGNFIEGIEAILISNLYEEDVLVAPSSGQKDVTALLKRSMGHLSRKPFDTVSPHFALHMIRSSTCRVSVAAPFPSTCLHRFSLCCSCSLTPLIFALCYHC